MTAERKNAKSERLWKTQMPKYESCRQSNWIAICPTAVPKMSKWLHVYGCWDLLLLQCTTWTGRHHSVYVPQIVYHW